MRPEDQVRIKHMLEAASDAARHSAEPFTYAAQVAGFTAIYRGPLRAKAGFS